MKIKKKKIKLVKDPHVNWKKMDGNSDLEKKLNGYLSQRFIFSEVPPDECLDEARKIIKIVYFHV